MYDIVATFILLGSALAWVLVAGFRAYCNAAYDRAHPLDPYLAAVFADAPDWPEAPEACTCHFAAECGHFVECNRHASLRSLDELDAGYFD